jgi:hypothetical protein
MDHHHLAAINPMKKNFCSKSAKIAHFFNIFVDYDHHFCSPNGVSMLAKITLLMLFAC